MAGTQIDRFETRNALRKVGSGIAVACLMSVLAACGGGGDDEAAPAAQNPPPSGGNQAPTISGSPGTQALQGQQYSFTPSASDANGDSLTFSIVGTPSGWSFNTSTGQLSGTPTQAQAGQTFSNIRISVSDGTTTVNLAAFNITVVATATGSATLSWTPPTQNTDGSAIGSSLTGYRIYWGTSSGNYTNSVTVNNPGLATYVVEQLTPATWYFAVSALNNVGNESALSNPASKQVL